MIALIPSRAGSKRLPGKNLLPLGGKPLVRWTIDAALESECFDLVAVCSDDFGALGLAQSPVVCVQRDPIPDDQRDIEWVQEALNHLPGHSEYAILRPTSPFRDAACIRRAKDQWDAIKNDYDSMRAVTPTKQHPMKQWSYDPETHEMWALMKAAHHKHMHSRPTQELGDFYAQTAALEMAWTDTPLKLGTIAGDRIAGFLTEGREALDVNALEDFEYAEYLVAQGLSVPSPH